MKIRELIFPIIFFFFLLPLILAGCRGNYQQQGADADRLFGNAQALYNAGEYEKAKEALAEAMKLNAKLDRDSAFAASHALFARIQQSLGQYDSALAGFRAASEHFRLLGDKRSERSARIHIAQLYYDAGEFAFAAMLTADLAANATFFNDTSHLIQSLLISAKANVELERYEKTLTILNTLASVDSQYNNGQNVEEIFRLRLYAYTAAHEYGLLRRTFSGRLSGTSERNGTSRPASLYYTMGKIYVSMNHPDSATRYFSEALTLLNGHSDRSLEECVLMSLGILAFRSGRFDQAERFFRDASDIATRTSDALSRQALDIALAVCETRSGGLSDANVGEWERRFASMASSCRRSGFLLGEATCTMLVGECLEFRQDFERARVSYDEAIRVFERHAWWLPVNVPALEIIDALIDGQEAGWYDRPLQLACSGEHTAEAFALVERKNLNDIGHFFSRLTLEPRDVKLNQQLAALRWNRDVLSLLERDMTVGGSGGKKNDSSGLQPFKSAYNQQVKKLDGIALEIEALNPNYRWLVFQTSLALKEVQSALPLSAALVEYAPLGSSVYCIVVTHDSAYCRKQNINRQNLFTMVREYNRILGDPRLNVNTPGFDEWGVIDRINELSPLLYNILVAPIMPLIENATMLYIVPPAEFGWLPFHTLRAPHVRASTSIFEKMDVSYLPSAAVLLFRHEEERPVRTVVGFGHSGRTTWDVEYELKDIRSFYEKARMLFDTSATLFNLGHAGCELLQVGAEFVLDTKIPDNSVIQVSDGTTPDGVRSAPVGELLSACPPIALVFSNISPTAGAISRYVPLGALANGSPTVIATMWQGERKAKKYFGEVFYTDLMTGALPSHAYRQAMVAMTKKDESSPLHRWGLYFRFGK